MFEPQPSSSWSRRAILTTGTLLVFGLMAAVTPESTCRVAAAEEKQPAAQPPSQPAAGEKSAEKPAAGEKSAEKPAAGEKQAEKPDPYAWQSLFDGKTLKGWKAPEFGGEGKVHVEDGAIVLEMGNSMTGITWTGEPPKTNYELTLEGSRRDGTDFFATTTFPVGEKCCSFVTGGWGGTVVGLSCVDYYDASDNYTTKFHDFKAKQWYKFRIRVSDSKIEVWIDDEKFVDQTLKGHKISIRDEVDPCRPLGVSSWDTKGAVRNLRLRRLKPDEIKQIASEVKVEE